MVAERPQDPLPGQSAGDVGIVIDESVVIEIDELVPHGLGEYQGDDHQEKQADGAHRGIRADAARVHDGIFQESPPDDRLHRPLGPGEPAG